MRQYPVHLHGLIEARQQRTKLPRLLSQSPLPSHSKSKPHGRRGETTAVASARKLSFKEQRELETLEATIAAAERRQAEIEEALTTNSSDARLVHELYQERELLALQLASDLGRWAELA